MIKSHFLAHYIGQPFKIKSKNGEKVSEIVTLTISLLAEIDSGKIDGAVMLKRVEQLTDKQIEHIGNECLSLHMEKSNWKIIRKLENYEIVILLSNGDQLIIFTDNTGCLKIYADETKGSHTGDEMKLVPFYLENGFAIHWSELSILQQIERGFIILGNKSVHTTIGVYKDGSMKLNGVFDYNLQDHINYNVRHRPGRALFVDRKCVHKGYLSDYEILKFEDMFDKDPKYTLLTDTAPYE